MKMRTVVAAAAALVPLGVAVLSPAGATAHPTVVHHPANLVKVTAGAATTLNWSGYVVPTPAGHQITAVHTRFTVPAAKTASPGGAALWTGIGGWQSSDLIQAGVSTGDILAGANYAWYEMLPDSEIPITGGCSNPVPTCAVNTGDTVQVDINHVTGDTWRIALNNFNHWTWSKTVTYKSTFSSAEWILEAPSLIVPMFVPFVDDTTFGPGNTFAVDHRAPQKIGKGNPQTVNMALLGIIPEAKPSAMASDGDRFRGCAYKSGCPTP
jgi:hypothetical protein